MQGGNMIEINVANKEDYIKFYSGKIDVMKTFTLQNNTKNYVINRVRLGNENKDVEKINTCINNLLDEQYEKGEYIKLKDIQSLDDLILKLDNDKCKVLNAYAQVHNFTVKDLKEIETLINNIRNYTILEVHTLHEVGILVAQKIPSFRMGIEVIPYVDFRKLGSDFLYESNIKENFCSYGLLVDTNEMYENDLIQPNIDEKKILKVRVANKKEYEESENYSNIIIYLPSTKEEIQEKLKKINIEYDKLKINDTHVIECEKINSKNEKITEDFNKIIKKKIKEFEEESYITPFEEIEKLSYKIEKYDNYAMEKFLALINVKDKEINYIRDIVNLAEHIDEYELIPEVKDFNDMGKYLVLETGFLNDINLLDKYIDYSELAKDYLEQGVLCKGDFTEYGYIIKNNNIEKRGSLKKEEEEEFE